MGYEEQARKRWEDLAELAWQGQAPATTFYEHKYQPMMRGSLNAARGLDQTPAIFSGYGATKDALMDSLNRMNLGQTGTAMSKMSQVGREQTMAAQEAQTRARLAKQQALQSLSGQSLQGYVAGLSPLWSATSQISNIDMTRAGMQQQQDMMQQQQYMDMMNQLGQLGGTVMGAPMSTIQPGGNIWDTFRTFYGRPS